MKTLLWLLMSLLLVHFPIYGQNSGKIASWLVMTKADKCPRIDIMPSFPEGNQALEKYCYQRLREAEQKVGSQTLRLTGYEAYISFQLKPSGEISDVRLLKSSLNLPEMDTIVLELVHQMPKWSPCKQNDAAIPIGIGLHLTYNPKAFELIKD